LGEEDSLRDLYNNKKTTDSEKQKWASRKKKEREGKRADESSHRTQRNPAGAEILQMASEVLIMG